MRNPNLSRATLPALLALLTLLSSPAGAADAGTRPSAPGVPVPHVIRLDAHGKDGLPVLPGPPQSYVMRSGLVVLAPGRSVGRHDTKGWEELVVVLEGRGEALVRGGGSFRIAQGDAFYCPPDTEHDIRNTGPGPLRYVYVVGLTRFPG